MSLITARLTLILVSASMALGAVRESEGDKPFTPTACDWAVVELNSLFRIDGASDDDILVYFERSTDDADAVVCRLGQPRTVSDEAVKSTQDHLGHLFGQFKERRGWKWIRLEFVVGKT